MRRMIVFAVALQLIHISSAAAACKAPACQRAVAWKVGYAAIVLSDDISRVDFFAVRDAVTANQGRVAIETERVLLAWVPMTMDAKLRRLSAVRLVLRAPVAHLEDVITPTFRSYESSVAALTFFNHVQSGEYEDQIEAGLAAPGPPLTGCLPTPTARQLTPPTMSTASAGGTGAPLPLDGVAELLALTDRAGASKIRRPLPNFDFQQPFQNPDMRGRVTVQVFRLESTGVSDPNLYTWTSNDLSVASDQTLGAFTFWVNQASLHNVTNLSFYVRFMTPNRLCRCGVTTPTQYEPITHSHVDDYLWVNDALSYWGYPSSPVDRDHVLATNEAFNQDKKADPTFGPFDRSFSTYLVYNPPPASTKFADGYRAYTVSLDGPYVMMMWDSAGWGPNNIGLVLSHETGHIFWACDEYYDEASNTGCRTCDVCIGGSSAPRLNVPNRNCAFPSGSCFMPRTSCMMDSLSSSLCDDTPTQIGW